MSKGTRWVIGFDIGDRRSTALLLDAQSGDMKELPSVATTRRGVERLFRGLPAGTRVIVEAGTHAGWIATLGRELGIDVFVADARRLDAVTKNIRKSDRHDAEMLARMGASSMDLLRASFVRDPKLQADLAVVRVRDAMVSTRSQLINAARGVAKSLGERLPSCSSAAFAKRVAQDLPPNLAAALGPTLLAIEQITKSIALYDAEVERLCAKHTDTNYLRQVSGVGPLTALCFVLTIADTKRFRDPRDVGAHLGLVPRLGQSGKADPQLRISRTGDGLLRRLLVQSAHHILGPFGKDCDLRTRGLALASRGAKSGKKRAICATARKLSVLLFVLWRERAVYQPLRGGPSAA